MHPTPPPYRPPGHHNLPDPPPVVTGRDTPPSYTPPWGTASPTTPWPPKAPEPPKAANGKRFAAIILAALGLLGLGVAIGQGGGGPATESADVTFTTAVVTTVAPVTAVRPTTTIYRTTTTTAPAFTDREIQELALDITWRDAPYSTQQDICDGVELFGVDVAAGMMIDGADGDFDRDIVERKLVEWCGSY